MEDIVSDEHNSLQKENELEIALTCTLPRSPRDAGTVHVIILPSRDPAVSDVRACLPPAITTH